MSKRNRESISPPLPDAKKLDQTEPHINAAKKSKQNMKQGWLDRPSRKSVSTAITKDEEEVAQTLYALARMFPDNKPVKSNGVDKRISEAKSSPLRETRASSAPASEDFEDKGMKSLHVSTGTEATNLPPREEDPLLETVKVESAIEHTVSEQPVISGSQKLDLELNSNAQGDSQRTGLLPKIDNTENMSLGDAMNLSNAMGASSELYPGNIILQPTIPEEAVPVQKPENGSWPAADVAPKQELQPVRENTGSGTRLAYMEEGAPKLWPGLPTGSFGGLEHLTRSSSTKAADWLTSATFATRPCSNGNVVSIEKIPPAVDKRRSWKRCAAHVYITHLIGAYQSTEKKSRWPLPASQVSQSKLKAGTTLGVTAAINDVPALRNAPNDIIASCINGSAVERNSHEASIGILNDKRLLPDQQASTASGIYAQQKQSCNFLSLSAGCEPNNPGNNGLESSAQLHVPYLHSLVQHPIMPFSLPHPRFSSPYPDQLAAVAAQQVQLQLPPQYLGNPYYGPHLGGHGAATQQQQQQQQQMWAAQLAHYRPGLTVSKWQNGKPDSSPSLIACGSAIIPPSPSSLEVVGGAKYSPNPQQQLFSVSSSSSSRGKRHHLHHPPSSGYDDGGGVRSEGSPHLQLLCNAQYM